MKNIEPLFKEYAEKIALERHGKSFNELGDAEAGVVRAAARVMAYKKGILPDGFQNFTIFNFDGISPKTGETLLDIDIATSAKDSICKYCWGLSWETLRQFQTDPEKALPLLSHRRKKMIDRHREGHNVVLFGENVRKKGRTFMASLIMREAVFLKALPGNMYTYGWVDFTQLIGHAKRDDVEYSEYKSCDWLVVDNISRNNMSANQIAYIISLLNDFFIERFEDKLPTILALKFDLRDLTFDPDAELGSGFARMIESNRTLQIPLSKVSKTTNVKD
jgi:hypothetical protein